MKFQILIELTFMLLARKKVTVSDIMNRFEISRSTVFRYIDALSLAKIPVSVIHGRNGGFFVPDEYKIKYAYFTDGEIRLLRSLLVILQDNSEAFGISSDDDTRSSIATLTEKLTALVSAN